MINKMVSALALATVAFAAPPGRIWSGGTDYTGTCNDGAQSFFYFGLANHTVGLSLSLGNACVPPGLCPSGVLNARAWVTSVSGQTQETGARQVPETPAYGVNFDFSDSVVNMLSSGRPRVQSGGRVGNNYNITTFDESIPGDAGVLSTVTGCNVLLAISGTYPGIEANAYPTLLATLPVVAGECPSTHLSVDCPDAQGPNRWLVYQIVTTAGPDPFVGPPLSFVCNALLADPKTKINPKMAPVSVRD